MLTRCRYGVEDVLLGDDGQTVIVGGLMQRAEDGDRQTIIAVTPRVNAEKR